MTVAGFGFMERLGCEVCSHEGGKAQGVKVWVRRFRMGWWCLHLYKARVYGVLFRIVAPELAQGQDTPR